MILTCKNVLITGATGGLGGWIAKKFQENGSNVFLLGRDSCKLQELCYANKFSGYASCDFLRPEEVLRASEEIKEKVSLKGEHHEGIDILVNCAGIFFVKSLRETSHEDYKVCFQVNVSAPYLLCKEFAPHMQKRGWGRIVNIASSSAYNAAANTSAYSTSKHALLGLSRALYNELKPDGVIVSCISPGSIQTPMGKEVEKLGQKYETFIHPAEIADYIIYNTALNRQMVCEEVRLNRTVIQ